MARVKEELEALTVEELKQVLKIKGLDEKGKKSELVERILAAEEADTNEILAAEEADTSEILAAEEADTSENVSNSDTSTVTVKVIDTYKDKERGSTQHINDTFEVRTERAEQLVAAGVAIIV